MERVRRVIAVSFGTSFPETREAAIGGIEEALSEALGGEPVYRCFTSGMVIRHIQSSEGIEIDDPRNALERAEQDGVTDLLIQPTHVLKGAEYRKFMNVLDDFKDRFERVEVGDPLLSTEEDLEALCRELQLSIDNLQEKADAVVLVGHGSETEADQVYEKLQQKLIRNCGTNVYVGTLESAPGVEEIRNKLQKDPGIHRVVLLPLMVVAGDHAVHDIAGEENSWKSILTAAGYEVQVLLKGLGEYPGIQKMYVEHLQAADGR